ncbi:putative fatty acyl-CoA reductase CG5065 [Leguminivora glycinivorella]|uniref:putative fatty acyl-CoA reductase CG5065 n=1 Tax=Leguminivora glycinivorella TaxID=1035111 RepID=UPI002010263A|nr:putative fatty acyl-CoA reductase CG5065 [Leguminivora glycinivorella]
MESKHSIRDFYKGRNILVTGGCGFMGKVLVEKLLNYIPDLGRVYLLMRPKRGKTVQQRLEHMLSSQMFNRLKRDKKEAIKKIIPIQGDVLLDGLGISIEDMKTLSEEVSVVFHMAASLKMEASLKDNLAINTVGTQRTLSVAKKIKNLVIFVYTSTAFCYPDYEVLEEKFHDPSADPHDVIRFCEWLDDKQVSLLTPSLLGKHPNTYTYTKRLAESLVNDAYPDMPCVIARPSIVCPAYLDPIPGWVDNINGPVGLLLGAGKGVIRTMLCDGRIYAQVIPVDGAINAMIALAMIEATKEKSENIPIYNLNVGHLMPITWGEVLQYAKEIGWKCPMAWPLWYPDGGITTNVVIHETKRVLFHLVPAYIIDFLLLIAGQKRIMVRIQEIISNGLKLLQYFTMREWHFPCPNYDAIHTKLSEEEDEMFPTYKEEFDVEAYLYQAVETGRVVCFKDDLSKIPIYRIYYYFLYVLDTVLKTVFWCFMLSLLVGWCEPLRELLALAEPVVKYLPFLGKAVLKQ